MASSPVTALCTPPRSWAGLAPPRSPRICARQLCVSSRSIGPEPRPMSQSRSANTRVWEIGAALRRSMFKLCVSQVSQTRAAALLFVRESADGGEGPNAVSIWSFTLSLCACRHNCLHCLMSRGAHPRSTCSFGHRPRQPFLFLLGPTLRKIASVGNGGTSRSRRLSGRLG